jgi:hypothetical protein
MAGRRVEVLRDNLAVTGHPGLKQGDVVDAEVFGEKTAAELVKAKRLRYVSGEEREELEQAPAPKAAPARKRGA